MTDRVVFWLLSVSQQTQIAGMRLALPEASGAERDLTSC